MQTCKPASVKKGMIMFSERDGLMTRITGVKKNDSISFRVFNGDWNGTVQPNPDGEGWELLAKSGQEVITRSDHPGPEVFEQVLSVTKDEFAQWYMGCEGVNFLIDRVPQHSDFAPQDPKAAEFGYENGEDPVFEAKIVVTVIGQAKNEAAFRTRMTEDSLGKISLDMNTLDLVGTRKIAALENLPEKQVPARLKALGNDGEFFNTKEASFTSDEDLTDPGGRILETQMDQGLSNATMEMLAREFIEQSDMSHAYAEFLRQRMEHQPDLRDDLDDEETFEPSF